jgi:gluconolactonase
MLSRISLAFAILFCSISFGSLPTLHAQKTKLEPAAATADEPEVVGHIEQSDPGLAELLDIESKIEVLTTGHQWTEGPVWIKGEGHLLFSDVPRNKIHKWSPESGHSVFMDPSGYDGESSESEPGSNGLYQDAEGRLLVCDHGNRRVYRVEKDGSKTTLAERVNGKRFNSPNDLVVHSSGAIYFTDPPYGLKDKTKREIDYCGVYRMDPEGTVTLLTKELEKPNGIGLSPDEKTLYVAQSHRPAPIYQAYAIKEDGTTNNEGKTLFNSIEFAEAGDPGMPDGMAIDIHGNLWATGPGGVLIISPDGKLLGRIMMGKPTANCAFGGDGSVLYITSSDRVCRVQTKTKGLGF